MHQGYPNFPPNLDISPSASTANRVSHDRTSHARASSADSGDRDEDDDAVQDIGRFGIAGRTWEAAYLLRDYCRRPPAGEGAAGIFDPPCPLFDQEQVPPRPDGKSKRKRTRTIVEVGSGTGFLSLAVAPYLASSTGSSDFAPTTLVMTDLDDVCPLLEENLARAEKRWSDAGSRAEEHSRPPQVVVRPLPWGDKPSFDRIRREELHPDIVLASDLIYFEFLYAPLLRTLIALTEPVSSTAESPVVLFSYKIRSLTREEPFWRAFGRWFAYEPVQIGRRQPRAPALADEQLEAVSASRSTTEDEVVWHRCGAASSPPQGSVDQGSKNNDDDELYIFVCSRHPSTFGILTEEREPDTGFPPSSTLFAHVSDEELLHGVGVAKGYEEGAARFEEILLADLQWD